MSRKTKIALPAPLDLGRKAAQVTLVFKAGWGAGWRAGDRVLILTSASAPEINQLNNTVVAP